MCFLYQIKVQSLLFWKALALKILGLQLDIGWKKKNEHNFGQLLEMQETCTASRAPASDEGGQKPMQSGGILPLYGEIVGVICLNNLK